MIVDSSAVVAILNRESDAEYYEMEGRMWLQSRSRGRRKRLMMSAITPLDNSVFLPWCLTG